MPLYDSGLGNALGDALGGFATQYVGTQNTLQQQAQQRQQQEADNQYRAQQAAEQRRQFEATQDTNRENRAVDQGQLALTNRNADYRTVLAPQMDSYMKGLDAEAQKYAPTLANGAPNPQYSPSLYEGAKGRVKAGQQAWNALIATVNSGQGYDEARTGLLTAIGANTAPATPAPASTPAAPPVIDMTFPAATPAPAGRPDPRGFTQANDVPMAAPAAPPAPPSGDPPGSPPPSSTAATLPDNITQIPASTLVSLSDSDIQAKYGQGGLEYATAARTQYRAQQQATRATVFKAQNAMWTKVIDNITSDKDHPATPDQLQAAGLITTYGAALEAGQQLTPEQNAEYAQAVQSLAPLVYTPATWASIVASKDPAVIVGSYATYQKVAPGIVQDFNITPFQTALMDTHNREAAAAAASTAAAGASNANAAQTGQETLYSQVLSGAKSLSDVVAAKDSATLLRIAGDPQAQNILGITDGGAELTRQANVIATGQDQGLAQGTATLKATVAGTTKTVADTAGVQASTAKTQYDLGLQTLDRLAGTGATLYQLQHDGSNTWYALKQQLHLSDGELGAVLQQARWEADQKAKGVVLGNTYKQSQILTEGATRAGIIASTANTQATTQRTQTLLPGEVAQQAATLAGTQASTQATQTSTQRTQTLLPGEVSLQGVQVAQGWSNIANVRSEIQSRATRDTAYVASVRSGQNVDLARIDQMKASTLLTRTKTPSDPLYNPVLANSKPGDAATALKNKAGLFYSQADNALEQVKVIQSQINSMTPKTDTFGNVIGTPPDPDKIQALRDQQARLIEWANTARGKGDKVITDGIQTLPGAGATPSTLPKTSITPGQYGNIAAAVTPGAGEKPQETRFLNALRGAEGNPNYGLVTESTGNTQQDRAIALNKLRRWMGDYANNTGHFAGLNPSKTSPLSGGDFTPAFVQTFSRVYAPLGVANDPNNLNANHAGNLMGFMQAGGWNPTGPAPKTTVATSPPAPKPGPAATPAPTGAKWAAPAASLPAGVKAVGSVSQFQQDLMRRGWFTKAAAAKDQAELMGLIKQATLYALPTGTADQRAVFQRDLFDSMAGVQ